MLKTKRRKLLTRRSQLACGKRRRAARRWWPRRRSRPGRPGRTRRPGPRRSASWLQAPAALRRSRFESKRKTKFFFKEISHPPPIKFLPKTGGRVYPVTSNLYQQFSVTWFSIKFHVTTSGTQWSRYKRSWYEKDLKLQITKQYL